MTARGDLQTYLDYVRPHYEAKDVAHDISHIMRICLRLDDVATGLEVHDRPLLHFLACWHGLADRIVGGSWFADATRAFLMEDGWGGDHIDTAYVALVRHSSSPVAVEERIVHDASAIELMGAFGIAAAFTQGGAEGRSYEETMVAHERFLERTEFKTPRGKELSLGGREYARRFLAQLRAEL
ncbi:phosphohydrolase [soil metagenome]